MEPSLRSNLSWDRKHSSIFFFENDVIQHIFSDPIGINIEINNRRITRKSTNNWKLNSTLLNNIWVKENVSEEKNKNIELNEMEMQHIKIWSMTTRIEKEMYSPKYLL